MERKDQMDSTNKIVSLEYFFNKPRNMTIIGSIIYRLIHDIYTTKLPIINPDVTQVNVKALPPLTMGGSPPTIIDPNTEEMIEGMYNQTEMSHIFLNAANRQW